MPTKETKSLLGGFTFEDLMAEVGSQPTSARDYSAQSRDSHKSVRSSNHSVKFTIHHNYGKLSNRKSAASFMLVDWDGYKRYDLRAWNEDYSIPFKGLSFTDEELRLLKKALSAYSYQRYTAPQAVVDMGKVKVKIYHTICELSSSDIKGVTWTKQVCVADWGYGQKVDFRRWTENYEKCSKGICLTVDEVNALASILAGISV